MPFFLIVLIGFLVVVGISVLIGGGLYLFQRSRAGSDPVLPMRLLLRLYLYVVILAGLLLLAQGFSGLLQVGLAYALGGDFSYRPTSVKSEGMPRTPDPPDPLDMKDPAQLTDAERERRSEIVVQQAREQARKYEREQARKYEREQRAKGLEVARKQGLIQGIIFTLIGGIIWGAHLFARWKLETEEDRSSPISRAYSLILLLIFGFITIIYLPQAVFEGFGFYLLHPLLEYTPYDFPGEKLALSIVTLLIWIGYLVGAIKAARGSD